MDKANNEQRKTLLDELAKLKAELDACKQQNDELANLLQQENAKLKDEADSIRGRLDQEREEIKKYLEDDNKANRDLLNRETENILKQLEEDKLSLKEKLEEDERKRIEIEKEISEKLDQDKERLKLQLEQLNKNLQGKIDQEVSQLSDKVGEKNDLLQAQSKEAMDRLALEKAELENKLKEESLSLQSKIMDETQRLENERLELEKKMELERQELERQRADEMRAHDLEKADLESQLKNKSNEANEFLQLFEKLKSESDIIKQKNLELEEKLQRERDELAAAIDSTKGQLDSTLKREIESQKLKLDGQAVELEKVQSDLLSFKNNEALTGLEEHLKRLEHLFSLPLSVYFNAIRENPYVGGGEEFLTFDSCTCNATGAMDPKSGIFTAPLNGVYLFSFNVCSHDMKKVLVSMKRNDAEIASIYDQNHVDNHKNSMAGNTIVTELLKGDRIQLYLYTFTGLLDKEANHLTQFSGVLLRPVESLTLAGMTQGGALPDKPRKRLVMSNEPTARKKISAIK